MRKGVYSTIALLAIIVVFAAYAVILKSESKALESDTAYASLSLGVAKTAPVRYYCETAALNNPGSDDSNACCNALNGVFDEANIRCVSGCVIDFNSLERPLRIDYNCLGVYSMVKLS